MRRSVSSGTRSGSAASAPSLRSEKERETQTAVLVMVRIVLTCVGKRLHTVSMMSVEKAGTRGGRLPPPLGGNSFSFISVTLEKRGRKKGITQDIT